MSANMKAFSLTHIVSILAGMSTAIVWTFEFFVHLPVGAFTAPVIFVGTLPVDAMAGVMSFFAYTLKASATGISESTTPPQVK